MITVFSIMVLSFLAAVISAPAADILKAFPPAVEGMVGCVPELPQQDKESAKS